MSSNNIIEIEGLHKSYSDHKALDNINLSIGESKIFGLLGPNGAGKTTLIRIINQILEPDQGVVKFAGEHLSRKHIHSIGIGRIYGHVQHKTAHTGGTHYTRTFNDYTHK